MPQEVWHQLTELMLKLVVPALAASLAVMLVLRLLGGERWTPIAAALAVAVGVVVGNHFHHQIDWHIDQDRPLTCRDARTVLGWSLETKPPPKDAESPWVLEDLPPAKQPEYWLAWLAGAAMLVELLAGLAWVPVSLGWVARSLFAMFAARLLTHPLVRMDMPAMTWLLVAIMLLDWWVLATLARQWRDGVTLLVVAMCFAAASIVVEFQATYLTLMHIAMLFAAAFAGPALGMWMGSGNTAPAVAAAVVLPGLLLIGQQSKDPPAVPWSFLLVGLAPLALLPMLLPFMVGQSGWRRWLPGLALPLIAVVIAIGLAVR